jgi:hypothetical protein
VRPRFLAKYIDKYLYETDAPCTAGGACLNHLKENIMEATTIHEAVREHDALIGSGRFFLNPLPFLM